MNTVLALCLCRLCIFRSGAWTFHHIARFFYRAVAICVCGAAIGKQGLVKSYATRKNCYCSWLRVSRCTCAELFDQLIFDTNRTFGLLLLPYSSVWSCGYLFLVWMCGVTEANPYCLLDQIQTSKRLFRNLQTRGLGTAVEYSNYVKDSLLRSLQFQLYDALGSCTTVFLSVPVELFLTCVVFPDNTVSVYV
jgi:hypothetical protein